VWVRSFEKLVFEVDGRIILLIWEGDRDFDIQKEEFCQRKESRAGPETQSTHRD